MDHCQDLFSVVISFVRLPGRLVAHAKPDANTHVDRVCSFSHTNNSQHGNPFLSPFANTPRLSSQVEVSCQDHMPTATFFFRSLDGKQLTHNDDEEVPTR